MAFKKGHKRFGGRSKGTPNRYTLLKEALAQGLELAAKEAQLKGGVAELVSHTFRKDPVGVLNIVARQIPKDLNIRKEEVLRIILEPAEPPTPTTPEAEFVDPGASGGVTGD